MGGLGVPPGMPARGARAVTTGGNGDDDCDIINEANSKSAAKEKGTKPTKAVTTRRRASSRRKRKLAGEGKGIDARSESTRAASAAKFERHKTAGAANNEDEDYDDVRYQIDLAKTSRSKCRRSGLYIPKNALRWCTIRRGIPIGGFVLLENVTPRMLRNAIATHGSVLSIHGLDELPNAEFTVRALKILWGIAMSGGKKFKVKKSRGRKEQRREYRTRRGVTGNRRVTRSNSWSRGDSVSAMEDSSDEGEEGVQEDEEELNKEDEAIMVIATKTLKERLKEQLSLAEASGDVVTIEEDDGDNEETANNGSAGEKTEIHVNGSDASEKSGTERLLHEGSDAQLDENSLNDKKPNIHKTEPEEDMDSVEGGPDNDEHYDDLDYESAADDDDEPPNRLPAAMDMIIIQNLPGVKGDALCMVETTPITGYTYNGLDSAADLPVINVSACMSEFTGTREINLNEVQWRFAPGQSKTVINSADGIAEEECCPESACCKECWGCNGMEWFISTFGGVEICGDGSY